jgi:hypothetical protein
MFVKKHFYYGIQIYKCYTFILLKIIIFHNILDFGGVMNVLIFHNE